jgi:hypothetical protein
MASINSFKLLNQKCNSYFRILENELGKKINVKKESDKERFGFYIYMLESICNVKDTMDIVELITDTDFNSTLFNDNSNDCGVDAIYIDEDNNQISMFNFKFRESFKPGKSQDLNDTFITTKFTNAILNNTSKHLDGKLKVYADEMLKHLNSKDVWNWKLYLVSNENTELNVNDGSIQQLEAVYDLEVIPIALAEISNFMSIRPNPIDASLIVDNEAIMSYSENSLASAKSFIIRLTVPELIRITCTNKAYREKYNIEDYTPLTSEKMDFAVLFDNVRGFLGDTKYNNNIVDTLKRQPTRFFMYNNGLTLTAEDIASEPINGNRKMKLAIKNLQVVNGGQTLRTIHNFNSQNEDNLGNSLLGCEVLVRIFKTGGTTDNLINKIAEYTNSQNAISMIDLKSLAQEQILIEQFLDESNIIYARKAGDTGLSNSKVYDHKISMEKFAQILFSIQGFPEKASNQKKKIFEKYYEQTFLNETFDISNSAKIVKRYYEIKNLYENEPSYKSSDQKIFYILYMDGFLNSNAKKEIRLLEKTLTEFRADENIPEARKLIQSKFKDLLDTKITAE